MPSWLIVLLIVVVIIALDVLVVYALISSCVEDFFNALAKAHPVRPMLPGAKEKSFQSFSMGIFNLGSCVHVGVDEQHVHLAPAAILRWVGAKPCSVPVALVVARDGQIGPRPRRWTLCKGKIGGKECAGPEWMFRAAQRAVNDQKTEAPSTHGTPRAIS